MTTNPSPLESPRPLIVYMDFKSPYAWLALHPTLEMAREIGIDVDWRPFVLDIPSYLGTARLDGEGRVTEQQRSAEQWSGVKYAYFDCRRYANLRKLTVRGTVKIWDTNLAAMGMLWAKNQGDEVLEPYLNAVYEPFWKRELDVEEPAVIEQVLAQAGADLAGFEAWREGPGARENTAQQEAAFDAGIFGVPTYVVDGERFFGREHLPRIRWLLSGKQGQAPDIAYESAVRGAAARGGGEVDDVPPQRRLELCFDFANPNSYLALAPTLALADELGLELDWHPFQGDARTPRQLPTGEGRGARHFRYRADYRARDIARYAGRELPAISPESNFDMAAMAVLWLKQAAPRQVGQFVRCVFTETWENSRAATDLAAVRELLQALGTDDGAFTEYAATRGEAELTHSRVKLAERRVIGTPTYLLGDEPFLGRQHLPLIRARCCGQV